LTAQQRELLHLKQKGASDVTITQTIGVTPTQLQKQWSKLLEQAWEIRNNLFSGTSSSVDE
jgi:hypothetical protein